MYRPLHQGPEGRAIMRPLESVALGVRPQGLKVECPNEEHSLLILNP